MARYEYKFCHSRDFCPFEAACANQSVSGQDFHPVSIQMKKNDIAWSRKADAQFVYVVRSGLLASFIPFEDGYESLLALFSKGIVTGVSDIWMCDEACCSYGLRCLAPGVVCRIPAASVKAYIESRSNAIEIVANLMTNNVSCGLELTRILRSKNTRDKIINLLFALRDMIPGNPEKRVFHFTQEEIGDIIAENRLAVKRAMDSLEAEGAIRCGYGKISVNYPLLKPSFSSVSVRSPFFYATK